VVPPRLGVRPAHTRIHIRWGGGRRILLEVAPIRWSGSCRSLREVVTSKSGKGLLVTAVTPAAQTGGSSRHYAKYSCYNQYPCSIYARERRARSQRIASITHHDAPS